MLERRYKMLVAIGLPLAFIACRSATDRDDDAAQLEAELTVKGRICTDGTKSECQRADGRWTGAECCLLSEH